MTSKPLFRMAWLAAFCVLGVQGCNSGSGGSAVGSGGNLAPTARVQVLNGLQSNVFREGSEVLLTGKDSEDADGPVLSWAWSQTGGPAVQLIERNPAMVSFTAPEVPAPTTLTFELTVEDSDFLTGSTSVDVVVVPGRDADRFLSLDVRGSVRNTFGRFRVLAALDEGASTDGSSRPFTLSVRAYVVYPPRTRPEADCRIDAVDFAGGVPASTMTGCHVELLEDLTPEPLPGGGSGVQDAWPAGIDAVVRPHGLTAVQLESEWWNPTFTFPVPRLVVTDFNQRFIDGGQRHRMLDPFNAHRARIVLHAELAAPQNQRDATLIVHTPGRVFPNAGVGLPTSAIVPLDDLLGGISGRESALTGEVYYRTVDPLGTRRTLNAWLQQAGFASDARGRLRPEAIAGTGEFAHALYLNNYDLGFGREMYMRVDEYGNVYSFVVNYATLEAGIRKTFPIVTVAMEYSPLHQPGSGTEPFVKFFTYVEDGSGDSRLVTSMDFDGRGERFTPGNCVACHGGVRPPGLDELDFDPVCGDRLDSQCYAWPEEVRGVSIAGGNLGATFLPFDLDSLLFADTDPAITNAPVRADGLTLQDRLRRDYGDRSRAAQETQLKRLNEAVRATYCDAALEPDCSTDAARRFIEHWYAGVTHDGRLASSVFDDSAAPPGWRDSEEAERLYHDVFAQYCRMCHVNIAASSLRFDTYQAFIAQSELIRRAVFEAGTMPAARLTYDRFHVGTGLSEPAAQRLAEALGVEPVEGHLAPVPRAVVTGAQASASRHDIVRLSGADSPLARDFQWSVDYQPPPALRGTPSVAGFRPTLVGATTPELAFAAARSGTYRVSLTINDGAGPQTTAGPIEIQVPNAVPQPVNLPLVVTAGETRTLSVVEELNLLCASAGCPEVFGDAPFSVSIDVSGWNAAHGQLTVEDAESGTITLAAAQNGPVDALIPYAITDADLESAAAHVEVTIVEPVPAPMAHDDQASMQAQTTLAAAPDPLPRRSSLSVLANDSGQQLSIHSFTQPANGQVTQNGSALVYQPNLGFVGSDTFTYRAADTHGQVSNAATVTVHVNATSRFGTEVQNAFSTVGCFGCHGQQPNGADVDWSQYSHVLPRTEASPHHARDSVILTTPSNAMVHPGGTYNLWVEDMQNPNSPFNLVLRWIEEGRRNN